MNFKNLCLVFVLGLVITGCYECDTDQDVSGLQEQGAMMFALKDPVRIYCDNCSENELIVMREGMRIWNDAAIDMDDGEFIFEGDFYEQSENRINATIDLTIQKAGLASMLTKVNSPYGCSIKIRASENANVWAHEIGHCLGYMHSPNSASLMYPCVCSASKITDEIKEILKTKLNFNYMVISD